MATEAAVGAAVGGFVIFFILIWILFFAVGILALIFWIFMIVDVASRKFKQENDKVMWILIVILTGVIGAAIYYFIIKKPDKH
jgi:prolipoprotein diacylglyceryltransferase